MKTILARRRGINYICAESPHHPDAYVCGSCEQSLLYAVLGDECSHCQATIIAIEASLAMSPESLH